MIELILLTLLQASEMNPENPILPKFAFSQLQASQFVTVNDGVMGGRSSSELNVSDDVARYQGTVSLENNGGFASVRVIWPFDFNDFTDEPTLAVLKVKGDGQTYQFRLRTSQGFDGAAYSYSFNTILDQVQTIYIPISDFVPTFRGRTLRNMPILKFSDVQQMGVLVADSQVGKFSIDLIDLTLN